MAGAPTNALAAMSLKQGKDWGDPEKKAAAPSEYRARLTGFEPVQGDIFYFFNQHPKLKTIEDAEIVDILIDEQEQVNGLPVAWLVVNNKDAALRALQFSHELFDEREIIVTVDGLSLDTPQQPAPVVHNEPEPVQHQQPEPEPIQHHKPAPVEPEPVPQQQYQPEPVQQQDSFVRGGGRDQGSFGGGGRDSGDNDRRGGGGGGYGTGDRSGNDRGGGGYGSGYGRRDDDRQGGSNYGMGGGGGGADGARRYDRAPRGGDETFEMDAEALAKASSGRKRLNLKKRAPAAGTGGGAASSRPAARPAPSRSSIFGDAKPREEVLRKKGVDPNARPVRQSQPQGGSIRGGGNRGQPQQDPTKKQPPVVKNENVFDVLDTE